MGKLIVFIIKNMSESVFSFFRATNYLFYTDIAAEKSLATKVKIPSLGDLHLENIGTYMTKEGKIALDLNDFDDAIIASYTWDLARCATSIRLAAKEVGIAEKEAKEMVENFVKDYVKNLKKLAKNPEKLAKPLTEKEFGKHVEKMMKEAGNESQKSFIKDLTKDGKFVFSNSVTEISGKTKSQIKEAIEPFLKEHRLKYKDAAFHIAGKGSLGRNRFIILAETPGKGKTENIIVEIKEAVQPAAAKVLGNTPGNQATRVTTAANYFLPDASPLLGVTKMEGIDYFIREFSPANKKIELSKLNKPGEMKDYIEAVSLVVARAHARSGKAGEIIEDAGSKSDLAERIGDFASGYVKKVESDFKKFVKQMFPGK